MVRSIPCAVAIAFVGSGLAAFAIDAPPPRPPLTFRAALKLARAQNLGLGAARRERAIREARVEATRPWANPELGYEVSRDTPHRTLSLDIPLEVGGARGIAS